MLKGVVHAFYGNVGLVFRSSSCVFGCNHDSISPLTNYLSNRTILVLMM